VTGRTSSLRVLAAVLALGGCVSAPPPGEPAEDWRGDAARAASRAADAAGRAGAATWSAARDAGAGMKVAAHGVSNGFAEPGAGADYGRPPRGYADLIRKHFLRVMRVPDSASFRFGRPQKGYMNEGLLRGGGVAWRGYLVDVEVVRPAALFGDEIRSTPYVVRLRDGEVIDVHKGAEHGFLGRVRE
jgi:hypothetical protein